MTTALYRHYDVENRLLYVGISCCPIKRTYEHSLTSHWYDGVSKITIERFNSRFEAIAAEKLAIEEELPLHNVRANSGCLQERQTRQHLSILDKITLDKNVKSLDAFYDVDGVAKLLKLKERDIKFLTDNNILSCFRIKTHRISERVVISGWHILDYLNSLVDNHKKGEK